MEADPNDVLTSTILVTVVFGLFILSAILRIKNSWKRLLTDEESKGRAILSKLDLVFSTIFLVASLIFYSLFIVNLGR
jgi:hypothetical protein